MYSKLRSKYLFLIFCHRGHGRGHGRDHGRGHDCEHDPQFQEYMHKLC